MRRKDDILLKGAFEETFPDLLEFVFKQEADIFDLEKGFQFLDKELAELFPDLERNGGSRFVDLLAKVFLKSGEEKLILVHVEIQSAYDPKFNLRMFQYFYRIFDRYEMPVTALAVFTGERKEICENFYACETLGTRLEYHYNAFHISDYKEEELLRQSNRFALVILAAQKALKSSKMSNLQLADHRLAIARTFIESRRYTPEQIRRFLYFLERFLFIEDKEINSKFEKDIDQITGSRNAMGIIDAIKIIAREEGLEEGFASGERKAQRVIITNLLLKSTFNPVEIAELANVDLDFVLSVKAELKADRN